MTARRLEIFILVAVIAVVGIVYALTRTPVQAPLTQEQNQPQQQVPTNVIEYQGQEGKTALDILKSRHNVEVKNYSFGDMVVGIDGVTPDSSHFWAMYVNGQFSQTGPGLYVTKSSDTIKWQMDKIQ